MKDKYVILFIIIIGLVSYSYSLGGNFIWDDSDFILRNSSIRTIRNIPLFFTNPQTLAKGKLALENYRPLVTLSYAVDYMCWDLNPFGYHLTNTIFHILNAILVFLLMRSLAGREVAFFTAMLFVVHPMQTEAVSWISGRSNVLFAFFYLVSFILYIKSYTKAPQTLYAFSLLFFCFSLLSKEAAATLPLMIFLYDLILHRPSAEARPLRKEDKRKIFHLIPYLVILVNYLLLRYIVLGKVSQRPHWGESIFETWLTIPKLIKIYIQMLILPLNLCVDRQLEMVHSPLDKQFLFGILVSMLLLFVFFAGLRKMQTAAFFTSWFLITLSPFLNILPINILIAERFLYLPSIGISFVFSLAVFESGGKKIRPFYSQAFMIILILSILTARRNIEWKDELTLFKSDVKVEPGNARLHHNLGLAYLENGETELAEKELKKALMIDSDYIHNYINLGKFYYGQGRLEEAEEIVNKGLIIAPRDPELLNTLAVLYIHKDKWHEAETILRKTIELDPEFFDGHLNLGRLLEESGSYDDALALYRDSMRVFDTSYEKAMLWLRIAGVYERQGLHDLARETYAYIITAFPQERTAISIVAEKLSEQQKY